LRLASCAKDLGFVDDAAQAYKRALEIDERSALALAGLGSLAIHSGHCEAAESYLKRACALEEEPSYFTLLGVALRNVGKLVEAEEAYRHAIRLDPKYEEAYYNFGVLLRDDRPSEAEELFRKALELDPDYACAHRELGWALRRRGSAPGTEAHLRKAVELDPDDAWAHIYYGNHLWSLDNIDTAIVEFQSARVLKPNWTTPLFCLGSIHECALEDFDSAQSFYEHALEIDPDDAVTLKDFGRLCKKRGQIELAKAYLGRALLLDPEYFKARTLLDEISS